MQGQLIPVAEVMQMLRIHSRAKWYKRLEQHGIQVVEYEKQDYLVSRRCTSLTENAAGV